MPSATNRVPTVFGPLTLALLLVAVAAVLTAAGPKFRSDDPLAIEPETQDASAASPSDVGLVYDMATSLFVTSRMRPADGPARNVNTIDEVPDSSWYSNRLISNPIRAEDLIRGPNTGPPPNPERWVVVREKSAGFAPGFTAKDGNGETWFISFDPPGNPGGATAAMVVASKLFWALGYNQIETFITRIDPGRLAIDPHATVRRPNGKRTPMSGDDLAAVLERAARDPDGTYRVAAGRLLAGSILGPFRYEGTRPDDPNDLVDHRDRRELRALRVFGAWTNLTDLKAGNTLDALVRVNGHSVVRHYLQDVGSTFGIGANGPHDWDEGFEYFYQGDASRRRLLSLGFAFSPWQTAHYTIFPSVGRFESDAFDPVSWKPHAPTPAYMEMQPDDAFWAARRVAAFTNALIDAAVHTGQFADAAAERHLAATLAQRRDKIARAYLPAVNPLVNPRLDGAGALTCDNAAVDAGVSDPATGYTGDWFEFDNATGQTRALGQTRASGCAMQPPAALPAHAGAFVEIDVRADAGSPAPWMQPVRFYFRRVPDGWRLAGLERGAPGSGALATDGGQHEW